MLLIELKRAILNKKMLLLIMVLVSLLYITAYQNVLDCSYFININADDIKGNTEAINAIRQEGGNKYVIWFNSFIPYVSTFIVLFISLTFASSFFDEKNTKFNSFIVTRISRKKYLFSKIIANSCAGGFLLLISEVIYYIIISIFFNNMTPPSRYEYIITKNPEQFIFIHIFFSFWFGFCFAAFALLIASIVKRKITVYVLPLLISYGFDYSVGHIEQYYLVLINNFTIWCSTIPKWASFLEMTLLFVISSTLFLLINNRRLKHG